MKPYSFNNHNASWSYLAYIFVLCSGIFFSCKKYEDTEFNKGNTPFALAANKNSFDLNEKQHASDALLLNWTTGTNNGTNAAISYTLKIDRQGNSFQNPVVESFGKDVLFKKFTVKELNDLVLSRLNGEPNNAAALEARVIATVAENAAPADSSVVAFTVTPYQPVTTTLYLIGDAAPNGWDAGKATELTGNADAPGRFTWLGRLNPGAFKFITTLGQFLPSYNKGAGDNELVYRSSDSQPDNKFVITTGGSYSITVDLLESTIEIAAGPAAPPYSALWIVGDATPNGWNINDPNKLRVDRSNPYVFTYNEVLKAGEFKFPTSTGNWGTDFYMPLVNYPDLTSNGLQLVRGGSPDLKWKIIEPGAYKIKLDLETMKIDIKPFTPYAKLWMVGDATPAGWNIDNPTPLVKDASNPNIFTWEGALKVGEMKIPTATGNWGTDYFMPVVANEGVTSTEMKFVPGGSPDNKWKITEAGNYKITIDQLHETIQFEKQ
jgi:starch-binding outer membrane protein SusE/F